MEKKKEDMIVNLIDWFDKGYTDDIIIKGSCYTKDAIDKFTAEEKSDYLKQLENGYYTRVEIRQRFIENLQSEDELTISELYQEFNSIRMYKELGPWLNTKLSVKPVELR
jgi:hypothetical protein